MKTEVITSLGWSILPAKDLTLDQLIKNGIKRFQEKYGAAPKYLFANPNVNIVESTLEVVPHKSLHKTMVVFTLEKTDFLTP